MWLFIFFLFFLLIKFLTKKQLILYTMAKANKKFDLRTKLVQSWCALNKFVGIYKRNLKFGKGPLQCVTLTLYNMCWTIRTATCMCLTTLVGDYAPGSWSTHNFWSINLEKSCNSTVIFSYPPLLSIIELHVLFY